MRTSKYFATDNSKWRTIVGLELIDINDGMSWKFRIANIASILTVEALAVGGTTEIIKRTEQHFVIFFDLESVLEGNSNTSTMNNTSHITQMLKDKTEVLKLQGKISDVTGSIGIVELQLTRELTWRQSNQSKKAETVNYCYEWPVLKPRGKEKRQRGASQFLSKHQTRPWRRLL
jgi:hypothetical protein